VWNNGIVKNNEAIAKHMTNKATDDWEAWQDAGGEDAIKALGEMSEEEYKYYEQLNNK